MSAIIHHGWKQKLDSVGPHATLTRPVLAPAAGGNLPTDFGFPIDVHAHEPDTVYVVPITSDAEHFPPEGKLRVYRSRTGGDEWEALTSGLPQEHCYVNVLRDAMAADSLDSCGVSSITRARSQLATLPSARAGWHGGACGQFAWGAARVNRPGGPAGRQPCSAIAASQASANRTRRPWASVLG